jgi:hypothetical protein
MPESRLDRPRLDGVVQEYRGRIARHRRRIRREKASRRLFAAGMGRPTLRFAVCEPFPSKTSQTSLVTGQIRLGQELSLRSLTPENGVVFSDGIEADRLDFNSGTEARTSLAERQGRLVV